MSCLQIAFFASRSGSNMQAIIDACRSGQILADPRLVIGNNKESGALQRAAVESIPYFHLSSQTHPENLDEVIMQKLEEAQIDLILLAGYMRRIGPKVLQRYKGRILNIHPSLLPKFGGKGMFGIHVHQAVISAGEKQSGATVHIVEEEYDKGPVLGQSMLELEPGETAESLQRRVLKIEHQLYVDVLSQIVRGEITLPGLELVHSS